MILISIVHTGVKKYILKESNKGLVKTSLFYFILKIVLTNSSLINKMLLREANKSLIFIIIVINKMIIRGDRYEERN